MGVRSAIRSFVPRTDRSKGTVGGGRAPGPRAASGRDHPESRRLQAAIEAPSRAEPETILDLQRIGGNRAVRELLAERGVLASLTVGPGDDAYEREADQVAGAVTEGSTTERGRPHLIAPTISPVAQRHTPDRKPGDAEQDSDELQEAAMQRKSAGVADAGFEAGAAVESTLDRQAGKGKPLEGPMRADMQARFGTDFGGVRIHDDGVAVQLNRAVSANAFTRGQDIYFGSGQYAPGSEPGRFLLAHELTHVVQQGGRRTSAPVQRDNIPRGAELPDLGKTTGRRLGSALNTDAELQVQSARAMFIKLLKALATDASLRQALGPASPTISDDAIRDVREAYVQPLRNAVAEVRKLATAARSGKPAGDATALVYTVENEVDTALRAKAKGKDLQDRKSVVTKLRAVMGDREGGARTHFEETRGDVKLEPAYLKDADRASFSAALKQLASVQSLLGLGPTAAGGQPAAGTAIAAPEWRDPGKLSDRVVVKDSKGIPGWLSKRRREKSLPKFKAKVDQVDGWLRTLLEPEVMRRVPRPEIWMHTRGQMKVLGSAKRFFFLPDPTGFRPNYGQGKVHLSFDESYELIAHEMGHAIEEYLPIKSWHDMNLLLERRHGEKVGSSRAARTGATFWTSGRAGSVENEGRYAGSYVTGKYTSTAYDDAGNAEVFSQALEFFSKPADALKLIEGDPQHAAIVLRAIRPTEYAALSALRPFDQYLPIGKGGSGG
jgi:hypothetical protein